MSTPRNPFSDKEDNHLVKFLAKHKPEPKGRLGQAIWQQLVENAEGKWPWAKSHTWQSWRERYKKNQDLFDHKIRQYQKKHEQPQEEGDDVQEGPSTRTQKPEQAQTPSRTKTRFTDSDDEHLAEFLASRGSGMGRLGNSLYIGLQAESEYLPWVKRHSWQSWRERYKKNQERIEGLVAGYESKKRVKKGKTARMPVEATSRAESSTKAPQASTSNSEPKEKQNDLSSKELQPLSSHSKGKEKEAPTSTPTLPKAPESTISNSKGEEKQKDSGVQPDQSTHIEMPQERGTGPAKSQRVKSVTPAPVPMPRSVNGKGKQKETPLTAPQVVPVPQREISVPPIAIKSQPESDGDVDMHSLFGSDDEEVDELEDSQSQNIGKAVPRAKPLIAPPPRKDLSPERILVPSSSPMPPVLSPKHPSHPPPPPVQPLRKKAPLPKPRLPKKDENIFVSSDAEQSPSSSPSRPTKSSPYKTYAEAPKIVEGPYRSQLKRVRSRVESDSDEAPPKRARRDPEGGVGSEKKREKIQMEERVSQRQKKENISPEVVTTSTGKNGTTQLHGARKTASQGSTSAKAPGPSHAPNVATPLSAGGPGIPLPRTSVPQEQVTQNAIASSSRVRLSDLPPLPKETHVALAATLVSANMSHPPPAPLSSAAPVPSPNVSVSLPISPPSESRSAVKSVLREATPRRDSGVVISPGTDSEADFFNAPPHTSATGKGKEREYVLDVRPPHIDLRRESLHRRHSQIHTLSQATRTESRASSASNATTSDRRSRGESPTTERRQARMSVASEDAMSALLEWMAPLIDMAAEYNVADAVAVRLFQRLMSMEKTDVVLFALGCGLTEEEGLKAYSSKKTAARAKEALAAFAQSKKLFEEDVSSGSGEEEMPSGLVLRSQVPSASGSTSVRLSVVKVERRESGANAPRASVSSTQRRRSRPSLIIRRIPPDRDDAMSDYIPPKNTRAGQYARLQRQGRVEEAKERERKRILITETQTQYLSVPMHSPTVSPTPHGRSRVQDVPQVMMEVDAVRVDGHRDAEQDREPGQVGTDGQERGEDSHGDVFVDAEEESQRYDVVMAENSDDEELDAQAGDGIVVDAADDVEERDEEPVDHDDFKQTVDAEEIEEEDQADKEAMPEGQPEEQEGEEGDADAEDGEEASAYDKDNGIFGSRESEQEPEEQYYEDRGTSTTNSDSDLDEHPRSSPPFDKDGEGRSNDHVTEAHNVEESTENVDEDDDDIYMPESLEMPYPGQPQRQEDSQEVPETELEVARPTQSSTSRMQPSSLPSLLTFGSSGPDKDPAVADIAKDHHRLALETTAENYQKLDDFERKYSDKSDLLRLWSIKWAKALMHHHTIDDE